MKIVARVTPCFDLFADTLWMWRSRQRRLATLPRTVVLCFVVCFLPAALFCRPCVGVCGWSVSEKSRRMVRGRCLSCFGAQRADGDPLVVVRTDAIVYTDRCFLPFRFRFQSIAVLVRRSFCVCALEEP